MLSDQDGRMNLHLDGSTLQARSLLRSEKVITFRTFSEVSHSLLPLLTVQSPCCHVTASDSWPSSSIPLLALSACNRTRFWSHQGSWACRWQRLQVYSLQCSHREPELQLRLHRSTTARGSAVLRVRKHHHHQQAMRRGMMGKRAATAAAAEAQCMLMPLLKRLWQDIFSMVRLCQRGDESAYVCCTLYILDEPHHFFNAAT